MQDERLWLSLYDRYDRKMGEYTTAQVESLVAPVRALLRQAGIGKGNRVVVHDFNGLNQILTYMAVYDLEASVIPIGYHESNTYAMQIADRFGAKAIMHDGRLEWVSKAAPVIDGNPLQIILLTSGSTGDQKAVAQGRDQISHNARLTNRHHGMGPNFVHASPLSLAHCNAYVQSFWGTLLSGSRYVMSAGIFPGYLDMINREEVNTLSLVPAMIGRLLKSSYDWQPWDGFRYIISAAAPLPTTMVVNALERWNVQIVQGYGLSESTNFSCLMPTDLDNAAYLEAMLPITSIGMALPTTEIRVGDHDEPEVPGELHIKSPSNAYGYLGHDPFGDWISTGDIGMYKLIDGCRFYYIVGRLKEQINRGGETLAPVAIEEQLRNLGYAAHFAVAAIPDERLGEEVGLIYVDEPPTESMIDSLPKHIRPKRIVQTLMIPQTITGKVKRNQVTNILSGRRMSRDFPKAPDVATYAQYMNLVERPCLEIAKMVAEYEGDVAEQAEYLMNVSHRIIDCEAMYYHDADVGHAGAIQPTLAYLRHMKQYLYDFLQGTHSGSEIVRSAGYRMWLDYNMHNGITAPFVIGVAAAVRRQLIHVRVDKIRHGATSAVLELGAGIGATTDLLESSIDKVNRFVVTDIKGRFLTDLQHRHGDRGIQSQILDIDKPEIEGQFNIIYATNVLHVSQDIPIALAWIHSALTDGGALIIGEGAPYDEFTPWPLDVFFALFDGWWQVPTYYYRLYPGFLTSAKWVELLHGAGFTKVVSETMAYKGRNFGAVIRAEK